MSETEEKASKTQSSYDEILEQIGNAGFFQTRFLIFIVVLYFLVSMQYMTKIITVAVPEHWCHVPGRHETNYTLAEWKAITIPRVYKNGINGYSKCTRFSNQANNETVKCDQGWEYDHTWYDMTASMKNNWVCDDRMIPTHVLALNRAADMIGTILLGHLADYYGRMPLFYVSLICILVGRLAVVFTSSWVYLFMCFSFLGSLANNTLSICTLVIAMEISAANQRALAGMVSGFGWGVGVVLSPLIMWWRRDWISYCLITTLPCCIFLFSNRIMVESPRWLSSTGNTKRCIKVLSKIAKANKTQLPEDIQTKLFKDNETKKFYTLLSIFSSARLAKNLIILVYCMCTMSLTYLCLLLSVNHLAGNPYLNYVFLGLIDLPVFWISKYGCDKFGRRFVGAFGLLTASVGNFIMAWIVQDPAMSVFMTIICILVKGTAVLTIKALYLQFTEICPTCIRQLGCSCAAMFSNTFAILGPYIVALGMSGNLRIPYVVYGLIALLAAILCIFLPETLGKDLPDTLEDAVYFGADQNIWGKSMKKDYNKVSLADIPLSCSN